MGQLTIDLQAGFSDDTVIITVDGSEVFRSTSVSTDYSIGRAGSVTVPSVSGEVTVTVDVASMGVARTIPHDVDDSPWLAISVADGAVSTRASAEAFEYF